MPQLQKTISKSISLEGRGLFSGEPTRVTIAPAQANHGIVFIREFGEKRTSIQAHIVNLLDRPRHTCLKNGTLNVQTVEHVLAALTGLGVDNATVTVTGSVGELPGGDGSSQLFVEPLLAAGFDEQSEPTLPLIIKKPITVTRGEASITALPGPTDRLEILYEFDGPPPVGRQVFSYRAGQDDFAHDLAPARTFAYEAEAREMQARGMVPHLTPRDILVLGENGPIDNEFRWANECARHKVLDILGDLSLVGRPIAGKIIAYRSGHPLNHMLAKRLLEQQSMYDRTELLKRDGALDIRRIQRILPHRYPMLLVDRVLEIDGDTKAIGIKNVTFNDVFFQGHYPGTPIFPGVLIVEAMAQLGGILLSQKLEHTGKLAVLLSMDKVKMRHPVVPGDQLLLEAIAVRVKSRTGHVRCGAYVGEKLAAEADIKFMLVDAEPA